MMPLIDSERLQSALSALAACNSARRPAVTRVVFSDVDLQARALIREWCRELGLQVREDGIGNLFARWVGTDADLPAVASGSHIDAIPKSGMYDGTVGVVAVLEAVRALQAGGYHPRRSIECILFTSEEPTRFGVGCLGSRALAGRLDAAQLRALRDADGVSLDDARLAAGFTAPLEQIALPHGAYHAFVELHIEQGPLLEQAGCAIGVVAAIAAPAALRVMLDGSGGHAGAVLMPERRDALAAAAELVLAVDHAARTSGPDSVATVGRLLVAPNAANAIPAYVELDIDVRDIALEPRDAMLTEITAALAEITARRGVQGTVQVLNSDPPAACDPALQQEIRAVAADCGLTVMNLFSRAYHDSLFMARICPTAMIFLPCRDGVSHRPDEYAAPGAIAASTTVLAETLRRLSC
jgi:ureidoglycolate amidohydrolase